MKFCIILVFKIHGLADKGHYIFVVALKKFLKFFRYGLFGFPLWTVHQSAIPCQNAEVGYVLHLRPIRIVKFIHFCKRLPNSSYEIAESYFIFRYVFLFLEKIKHCNFLVYFFTDYQKTPPGLPNDSSCVNQASKPFYLSR